MAFRQNGEHALPDQFVAGETIARNGQDQQRQIDAPCVEFFKKRRGHVLNHAHFNSGMLAGEAGLGFTLRRRLQAELEVAPRPAGGGRTAAELFAGATRAKHQAAERKAVADEKRRIAALEKLAKTQEKAWQTVAAQLAGRAWTEYAKAVEQLQQLRDLADYQHTRTEFDRRLAELRAQYQSRAAIMRRFEQAGLR